jgi:hypothetical protein
VSKLKIRLDDPETRRTWDAIQEATKAVEAWPAWKRGEDMVGCYECGGAMIGGVCARCAHTASDRPKVASREARYEAVMKYHERIVETGSAERPPGDATVLVREPFVVNERAAKETKELMASISADDIESRLPGLDERLAIVDFIRGEATRRRFKANDLRLRNDHGPADRAHREAELLGWVANQIEKGKHRR